MGIAVETSTIDSAAKAVVIVQIMPAQYILCVGFCKVYV